MFAIYYKVNLMPTILSLNYTEKTTQTDNYSNATQEKKTQKRYIEYSTVH